MLDFQTAKRFLVNKHINAAHFSAFRGQFAPHSHRADETALVCVWTRYALRSVVAANINW